LEEAKRLGLDHVACAPAAEVPDHALFSAWLAADLAGDMAYLGRDAEARRDPRRLLERAKSVVCVALSYAHLEPPLDGESPSGLRGQIARYARRQDYHLVLKRRLSALAERLIARISDEKKESAGIAYRVCVDSAPLLERSLAAGAGLGFIGKNTLLITPGVGSYTVLGELLLEFDLNELQIASATPLEPRCGACRLCLDVCPTGAIIDAYRIDARRCISYLTIENSGPIPLPLRRAVGTWIFGCDLCQEICPWNATAAVRSGRGGDEELRPRPHQSRPELLWLLELGAAQFRRFVKRTALRRVGRSQLLRNVAVALGNVGGKSELPAIRAALWREPPLVRRHLAWALGEIAQRDATARPLAEEALGARLACEDDVEVREEILGALSRIGAELQNPALP
jgi:epoxyqueuosine reductase